MKRGTFGQIELSSLELETKAEITTLVNKVASAEKTDAHGGWEFGIDGNGKGTRLLL